MASPEMGRDVTVSFVNGNGETVAVSDYADGSVDTSVTRSVADYTRLALEQGNDKQKVLNRALLAYGGYAQKFFKVDVNAPVYDILGEFGYEVPTFAEITADTLQQTMTVSGDALINVGSQQAFLDSSIYHRVYFTANNVEALAFTLTGKFGTEAVAPVYEAAKDRYYIQIDDIASPLLDYLYAIEVTDAEGHVQSIVTSVVSYLKLGLEKSSNAAQIDLFKAIYNYNQAANMFFEGVDVGGGNDDTDVEVNDGILKEDVSLGSGEFTATVPAGTAVEKDTLTLSVSEKTNSDADIETEESETALSLDVHVDGIAANNTKAIIVNLGDILPKALNIGNVALYHVEDGVTNEMTRVMTLEELDEHNEFYYDPVTGDVSVAMASFSEVALVAEETGAWEGKFDYTWYNAEKTELVIANADQLAGFGAIVGGMDGQTQDSFVGKTVTLIADIDLNDAEAKNSSNWIFYPIGYYNSEGTYERTNTAITSSLRNFEGTFDGSGHTIKNFYQNTWEMKGDHDWYSPEEQYYRDGMGLFGRIYGGTVKNLTVRNFSSDGEIATTGTIAAYADCGATFENISIFNCNPRVYNIGNGGIVGCVGWYTKGETDKKVTFSNITVDNSNKISALWGSYDVPCGGIVGQYYPTSGQTSAGSPANAGIHFENCHVAAIMDVNNDVCANYQYYAYRYAGILLGSVRENVTIDGHVYPKMDGITAKDCTVHFGDWNDYYYCELVANSLASYTHDHQFSRLTQVESVDVENMKIVTLKGVKQDIPASGRYNYVVVNGSHATENATCYHFVDGKVWNHKDAGTEIVNGTEVLKEDNQHIYLEFNNLVTGYGWGVTTKAVGDMNGVTILDRKEGNSVEKFTGIAEGKSFTTGDTVTVSELFAAATQTEVEIKGSQIQIAVSPADDDSTVVGTYEANTTDWTQGTLTFSGTGAATVTITDYYFCTPTTINVTVEEEKAVEKFTAENVGEKAAYSEITLGDLFAAKDGVTIGNVTATITVNGEAHAPVTGATSDWETKTIDLTAVGTWAVTITDDANCVPATATFTVVKVNKFVAEAVSAQNAYTQIALGTLFTAKDGVDIGNVTATVTNPNGAVTTISDADWKSKTINLTKDGTWTVSIADDDALANGAEVSFTVNKADKFKKLFDKDFLYRVGNKNAFNLGYIFSDLSDNIAPANLNVTVEKVLGNATGDYTTATPWTDGQIKFNGNGKVRVTISADGAKTVVQELEVVDAVNAAGAANATANNVVLLQDAGFGSLEVSGGYTLYGNGFTLTCGSDSVAADLGYAFVTLTNGTLDNVQIVCPNFDYAALYKSNLEDAGNRSSTDSTGKTRYYNARSGVAVSGDSQILNSRIAGGRASLNVAGGNVLVENSQIELGAVASILVGSANDLVLRDVTLVQKPAESTYKAAGAEKGTNLMGFSVLYLCDSDGNAAPTTIEGSFVQQAWIDETDSQYVPSVGQSIVTTVLKETDFLHDIDGDGANESLNLGFAYMPEDTSKTVSQPDNITDNRTNKATVPYEMKAVSVRLAIVSTTVYVYSYKNTNGTDASFTEELVYTPNAYSDMQPVLTYSDANETRQLTKSYDKAKNSWVYNLSVDLDQGDYTLDYSTMTMTRSGVNLTYQVDGAAPAATPVEEGTVLKTLTAVDDGKTYTVYLNLIGTATSKDAPQWSSDSVGSALSSSINSASAEAGVCVASSYGGTWSGAAPALQNIYVRYYSTAAKDYRVINLAGYTPSATGKLNSNNTTYTIAGPDFTLTLTGGQVHSGNKVNAIPVGVNWDGTNKLFFVAASSNGLVNSGNSARSIPVSYSFTDDFGNTLTGSKSWSVAEDKDNQYKYTDFCNGTKTKLESGGSGTTTCIAPDTLITLADGSQVRVDSLTSSEELLVWNMETGMLDSAPIMFVDSDEEAEYEVVHLYFSDGTDVKVIYEHGFWDYDLNRYVYLDRYAEKYIGHTFAKQNGDSLEKVQLTDVVIETEVTTAWSPVTAGHLCYFVNGMLSMPGGVGGLFNIFDVNPETMTYDYEAMARDIETYGLFTYEELNAIEPLTREMFEAAGGAYLKISIGKGNLTMDELCTMIRRYSKFI